MDVDQALDVAARCFTTHEGSPMPMDVSKNVVRVAGLVLVLMIVAGTHARSDDTGVGPSGNAFMLAGVKHLDRKEWQPIENQREIGISIDYTGRDWPLGIAVSVLHSSDEGTEDGLKWSAKIYEFSLGIRKTWRLTSWARPFLGGGWGLALVDLDRRNISTGKTDPDKGNMSRMLWTDGGVHFVVMRHVLIGLFGRLSLANNMNIHHTTRDAGGWHVGGTVGYHWGS